MGRYTLLDTLGAGGMGSVFLATQNGAENFRRYVAIKTLLPGYRHNEEVAAMFVEEAKSLATASHPNVVQTYDLFRQDDTLYAALEFVHGRDLLRVTSHLQACNLPMEPQVVCCVISEVARGLQFIHTLRDDLDNTPRQLVHRDINPKNILLGFNGGVKIADFGLLRSGRSDTGEKTLRGTLAYVAPEQLAEQPVDHRADIFALGCVMFELLSQRVLFGETEREQIFNRKLRRIPDVAALLPAEHAAFLPLLQRMVAFDPNDRYPSASELQGDLDLLADTLMPSSVGKGGGWMRKLYPGEEREWSLRKERYARSMEPSDFEHAPTAPTGFAAPGNGESPRSQLIPAYRPTPTPPVNILARSLIYVFAVAMVSLSVAALLYMVATNPVPPGADRRQPDSMSQSPK